MPVTVLVTDSSITTVNDNLHFLILCYLPSYIDSFLLSINYTSYPFITFATNSPITIMRYNMLVSSTHSNLSF